MRAAALIAGLMLAVILAAPADAGWALHHTLTEKQNVVRGTSAAETYRDMLRNPIIDPDSGRSFANLTHDHEVELTTKASGGQCQVTRLDFTWRFVMTLPKARDEAKLTSATRQNWRSFVARLRTHELHHRELFLDCGNAFLPKAAALTASTCSKLDRDVGRYIDRQYDACMVRQRAFDQTDTPNVLAHPFLRLARQ